MGERTAGICRELHYIFNSLEHLEFPFDLRKIPLNGIYILFERGESAHGTNRIVRVGTHTGANQLRSRIKQHFIVENKDRSIFRKNIGRAILSRDGDPFLQTWELDLTSSRAKTMYSKLVDFEKQGLVERRVTEYIQKSFFFVAFQCDDKRKRLQVESKIISTVSLCDECGPTIDWLGLHSPKEKIRESGLWLVNELYKEPLRENDVLALKEECSWCRPPDWS